jgi:acyl-CoA thioester hydrolase
VGVGLKAEDRQSRRTTSEAQVYETKLRVRYAETDQMGVVYHSNFVIWFEVGRVEMLRQLGFTYREMDMRCRYKAPARYDDMVTIRTRLVNVRDSLLHFGYEVVRDEDGTLLAEGETVHLVVDSEFNRIPLPQRYMASFLKAAGKN